MTAASLSADLTGLRILVVDDDPDARDLVRTILEICGASVVARESADGAAQAFRDSRPDVVVTDISMPGRDGYWLVSELRRIAAGAHLPLRVVAMTAHAAAHDRERAIRAGFLDYVTKPLDPDELCARVARVVGG